MYISKTNSIISLSSGISGSTTTILTGVHGNELSGVLVLLQLLKQRISITSGTVFLIFANLKALECNQRYYEKNMNRCFASNLGNDSYEEQRVRELLPYLEKSDYLLDVHNTLREVNSIPFLINEYPKLDDYFDVKYAVSGFDNLHPGGSDGYMNSIGKVGLCLEAGSIYDNQDVVIQNAKEGVLNFLRFTGNIAGAPILYRDKTRIHFDTIYKNLSSSFRFVKPLGDFEVVRKGQLLGYDGEMPVYADKDGCVLFAREATALGQECFCFGTEK